MLCCLHFQSPVAERHPAPCIPCAVDLDQFCASLSRGDLSRHAVLSPFVLQQCACPSRQTAFLGHQALAR